MKNQTIKKIGRLLVPYLPYILLSLLCAAATVVLTLEIPILTGRGIDCIVGVHQVDFDGLLQVIRTMAMVIFFTAFFQWVMNRVNNHITYSVTKQLRQQAFVRLQQLPIAHIDSHSHGDYVSRIVTDADSFSDGLLLGFTQLFTGVLTIFGTIGFMISINGKISLVVILLTPISLLVAKFISSRTYRMFRQQALDRGEVTEFASERIDQQKLVHTFSYTDRTKEDFAKKNEALRQSSLKATFYSSITNPATRFVNSLIYAVVCFFGASIVISGGITVGALSSFLGYASQYSKPFNEITGVITEMQNAIACAARIFELMEAEPETERDVATLPTPPKGRISIQNVAFSYVKDQPLLRDLNLEVEPGQKVAIVGPTGAGKTTMINLLMRFYDVDAGSITIDGVNINDIPRATLRSAFGMVLQETWLKEGTILENMLMANPDATREQVIEACKASHAHSFIKKLPGGYDTRLGSDGGSLSQGQKQLLCIARVMLNLPPMLILDEATSSIDTRTEMKIQEAFGRLMEGRTTFVVAHRLSTIMNSDIILYMEHGQVLEQGSHEALLAKNGRYAALYNSQFKI
ncbi:MAG: ABC transporter ATP-binding protein/permease [Lachnospiraceae bacterium]|nr:ABC transporter ATP-binding protein/permease [Lachnospiraceae bacterium]